MTKRILCLLLCAALLVPLSCPVAASAAGKSGPFDSEDAIVQYLREVGVAKPETIKFSLTGTYFKALEKENFEGIYSIQAKAGLKEASVFYNSITYSFEFRNCTYTGEPWFDCSGWEDVLRAFGDADAANYGSFTLICTEELGRHLRQSQAYRAAAAAAGYEDVEVRFLSGTVLQVSGLTPFAAPYATADDSAQFNAALQGFAQNNNDDFYIVFDPEFFKTFREDKEQDRILHYSSCLSHYTSSIDPSACTIHYRSAAFSDIPKIVCRSEAEVTEVLSQMGAAGVKRFGLVFSETMAAMMKPNAFSRLKQLEQQAGVIARQLSYTTDGTYVEYSEAEIVAEAAHLSSIEEAIGYVNEQVRAGAADLHMFCSRQLYEYLLDDLIGMNFSHSGIEPIYDLLTQAGICDFDISTSGGANCISVHIQKLFPGTQIILSQTDSETFPLTRREIATLTAARKIADKASGMEPLEAARYIHDQLCSMVVYTDDESTTEDDNAIGAILNGQANCDGYTDAFYLIGTLAGLNIRYQHGDSYSLGLNVPTGNPITHIWNLIELDGSWRQVDVTWDDSEEGIRYTWFNIGQDRASRMHIWNEEMTVPLAKTTNTEQRPDNEYYVANRNQMNDAIDSALDSGVASFDLIFRDADSALLHDDALKAVSSAVTGSFRYFWNERMLMMSFYNVA